MIKTLHINNRHCGYKALCNHIIANGFYWEGYSKEIDTYIKNCSLCNADKKKYKINPQLKIIKDEGPKYRYVMDLWSLPEELNENTEYIYILDIIDHFSKYFRGTSSRTIGMKLWFDPQISEHWP